MRKIILILIVFGVLFSGCNNSNLECTKDSDCVKAGCSSQLCVANEKSDIVTTCEYKDEYECYQKTSCGCVDGLCNWKENNEFNDCLIKFNK